MIATLKRLLLALTLVGGGTLVAAPAQASTWGSCMDGYVCFYTGRDGTGSKCIWDIADPDTTSGSFTCSWMRNGIAPKSVWNNGYTYYLTGVAYYRSTNYQGRIGCTPQRSRGNLVSGIVPRSLRWIDTACG